MENKIRILIADDHELVRRGLHLTLEAEPHLQVVAAVGDGRTALAEIQNLLPEIAVLDIDMPKFDSLGVAREIAAAELPVKIIFLTLHSEEALFHHALDAGALGYVVKDAAADDL